MRSALLILKRVAAITLLAAAIPASGSPLSLLSGELNVKLRANREKAGAELLSDVNRFADLVQSPRPAETSWVEGEQAAIAKISDPADSLSRSIQLVQSPEFQQISLYRHLQELRSALRCVVESPASIQREVFCWSVASFLLDDSSVLTDGTKVLLRANRLPEDTQLRVGGSPEADISFQYRFISRRIQQYIVLPYLRGEIR